MDMLSLVISGFLVGVGFFIAGFIFIYFMGILFSRGLEEAAFEEIKGSEGIEEKRKHDENERYHQ